MLAERSRLQEDAKQQVYVVATQSLTTETLRAASNDLERCHIFFSNSDYFIKRADLLADIEASETEAAELEDMYANFQSAAVQTDRARVARLTAEIAEYTAELNDIETLIKEVNYESENLKQQMCDTQIQLEKLKLNLKNVQAEDEEAQESVHQQTNIAASLQTSEQSTEMRTCKELNQQLCAENTIKSTTLAELHKEIEQINAAQDDTEAVLSDLQTTMLAHQLAERTAHSDIIALVEQAENERHVLAAVIRANDAIRADAEAAVAQAAAEKVRHLDMHKSLQAFEQSNATINAALERVSRGCEVLQAELSPTAPLPADLAAVQWEMASAQNDLDAVANDIKTGTTKISEISLLLQKTAVEIESLKSEAAHADAQATATRHQLKRQRSAAATKDVAQFFANIEYPYNLVPTELQQHISDLNTQLEDLNAAEESAAKFVSDLEQKLQVHAAEISSLHQQRKNSALDARRKVTLTENRRQVAKQQRARLRKLIQELSIADESFRADLSKMESELSDVENKLLQEFEIATQLLTQATAVAAGASKPPLTPSSSAAAFTSTRQHLSPSTTFQHNNVFDFDFSIDDLEAMQEQSGQQDKRSKRVSSKPKGRIKKKGKLQNPIPASRKVQAAETMVSEVFAAPPALIKAHRRTSKGLSLRAQDEWDWGADEEPASQSCSPLAIVRSTETAVLFGVENARQANVALEYSAGENVSKQHAPRKKTLLNQSEKATT